MLDEGRLHRVQPVWRAEAFDGGDLRALVHHRQRQAGIDAPAVHQHRAGTALAVVAALLAAGQVQVLTQGVEQGDAGVQPQRSRCSVHLEVHLHQFRCPCTCPVRLRRSDHGRQGHGGGRSRAQLQQFPARKGKV
ncbi:hypothetical protein D3C75_1063120 [compost metagenome]